MADEKTYKEILIKLSNDHIKEYENKNFNQNNLISKRNQNVLGATFSMPNCLCYILVQDKDIIVKNIRTINVFQKSSNQNYITFTHISLPNPPIKNIFPIFVNQREFLLIVFTISGIQSFIINIDFNKANQKNYLNCKFNINILRNTNYVELCGNTNDGSYRFCLGCENGKVFIVDLKPNYDNSELVVNKAKEIGFVNKGFLSYITPSFFSSNSQEIKNKKGNNTTDINDNNAPVNSVSYIGNDIIAVLRNNFMLQLININTGYIFFTYYLFDNIDNKEFINDSKIVSTVDETFTNDELKNTGRKIFYVFISINSFNINSMISFQLMFIDVNMSNISYSNNDFNSIDIGTNVKLKNRNDMIIYGEIIDMIVNENKLWLLYLNKKENDNDNYLINANNDNGSFDKLSEKYGLKILKIFEDMGDDANEDENNKENNSLFNGEEVLVDYNEKNLFYLLGIIKQLGYNLNKNNNIINYSDNDTDIILQQNKIIFSSLLHDKYFLKENIINYVNDKFHTNFKNKNLCYKYLEDKYLTKKMDNEVRSIINDIIIPLIQEELYKNEIISLGSFKNNDLNSITFLRQKELSFINVVDSFEKINDYIKEFEFQIRKLNSKENLIKDYIHSTLINKNQDNLEIPKINPLFLIFALNRIYLTEINLKTKNENFLEKIFIQKNLEQFKNDIIKQNLSCQMNPYNNLEFIHELINEIYSIYKEKIEENIKEIFNLFVNEFQIIQNDENFIQMITKLQNINNISGEINTVNITNKYCELITKIILSRVEALYSIANDIFCFKQWLNLYDDLINVEIPLNIDESYIDSFYVKNLILYIFCNHLTTYNTENIARINLEEGDQNIEGDLLNDKIVTWLEKFVFNKLSQLGYDVLEQQKNKFINYSICLILKDLFNQNINGGINSSIIKDLFDNKDYQLLSLYNLILINSGNCVENNIRDSLKLLIICNAANDNISQMKDNLILLYQRYPKYDNENNEISNGKYMNNIKKNYFELRNYLKSPNMFISPKTLQTFFIFNYDFLMNKFLNFIQSEDYANIIRDDIIEIDDENIINNEDNNLYKDDIINYIVSIIDDIAESSFDENEDLCLIIYSKIENLINNSKNNKKAQNIYNKIKNGIIPKISIKVFNSYNINKKITSTIIKLSKLNRPLLFEICRYLEKNLIYGKNNEEDDVNDNIYKKMFEQSKKKNMIENKIDIYYFLNISYLSLMEYEHLIKISKQFIKILDIYISMENVSLLELINLYNQKIFAQKNSLDAFFKKKQLNSFISEDQNELDKINKDKIITEIKVEELKYYAITKKEDNDEDEILKIKNDDNTFIDYIFEFNILKEAIESDLVKCLGFKEAKLFIYNILNCLVYDVNQKTDEQSKLLELFIKKVFMDINRYNDEYMFITLELLIKMNHSYLNSNNFEKILKTLEHKNKIRLQELLYCLTSEKKFS